MISPHRPQAARSAVRRSACSLLLVGVLGLGAVACTSDSPAVTSATTTSAQGGAEAAPVTTAPALGLADTADFGGSVTAKLTEITPVQAAPIVGAAEEPSIAVTVEIDNNSATPIGLDAVAVTLTDSTGTVASTVTTDQSTPFGGMVVEGGTAQATYVFRVPPDARDPVTVALHLGTGAPTQVFSGEVATG